MRHRVRLALALTLAATAVSLALVLARAPLVVAGDNGVPAQVGVTFVHHSETLCQGGGTLPAGTRAIRVSLSANVGPSVRVQAFAGSRLVTAGSREAGWGTDETVTVPIARVAETVGGTRVCVTVGPPAEPIQINGTRVATPAGGEGALLRTEYLRPGPSTWGLLIGTVAHNMGLDHAPRGAWGALLVLAAMFAVCVLVSRTILSNLR